jgi:hypothetical protein
LGPEDTFISQGKNGLEEIDLAALMNEVRRIEQTAVRVLSEDSTVTRVYPNLTLNTLPASALLRRDNPTF